MMDAQERAHFLQLLPQLAPDADVSEVLQFARIHQDALLHALGELPGFDALRAGVLRLLPVFVPSAEERVVWLNAARDALLAFRGDEIDARDGLRRHPSWVALAAREWAALVGTDEANQIAETIWVEAACALARLSPMDAAGPGEIMWAVAEMADEVDWHDHGDVLLERALELPFDDKDNRDRVLLLWALRLSSNHDARVFDVVDDLIRREVDDEAVAVQALYLGAHLDRENAHFERAFERLRAAISRVDRQGDDADEDLARLNATLSAWEAAQGEA